MLGHAARLTVRAGSEPAVDLSVGPDFFPLPESSDSPAAGPLVFAGHGLSAPELGHDDYARIHPSGAIVVVLDDAPEGLPASMSSEDKAEIGGIERKMHDALAHGAVGLLVVKRYPGSADYFWPEHASVRSSNYRLFGDMRAHPLAVATISEKAAAPIRRALEQAEDRSPPTLTPDVIARPIIIDNILGMIEGAAGVAGDGGGRRAPGSRRDRRGRPDLQRRRRQCVRHGRGARHRVRLRAGRGARRASVAGGGVRALERRRKRIARGGVLRPASPVPARPIVANINLDMVGRDEEIPDPDDPRFSGFAKTDRRAEPATSFTCSATPIRRISRGWRSARTTRSV